MRTPRVGLLPFYLELYDKTVPEERPIIEKYLEHVCSRLQSQGMELISAPICRISTEFDSAAEMFNEEKVCAVITLHLVYSPSLESIEALKRINAPLIILDTTPAWDFCKLRNDIYIMENHGIHGVQDMCNLLSRNGVKFWLEAGHIDNSDILQRVDTLVRAAYMSFRLRTARIGCIGGHFEGMGDFFISDEDLKNNLGITVSAFNFANANELIESIIDNDINAEYQKDISSYKIEAPFDEDYRQTLRSCLMVRRWMECENLDAFTYNFSSITAGCGIPRVPFLEASKAMSRGLGFAGEGDTLTAALISTLLSVYPDTTFAEMFCPGWSDNTIFLSHMGEFNLKIAVKRPVIRKMGYNFSDCGDIVTAYGAFQSGSAIYVNLAPAESGKYRLILSPIEMLEYAEGMKSSIEGYFRPCIPLTRFLKEFSLSGGTHHGAVVYGGDLDTLIAFGEMMGFEVIMITDGGNR